jgi:hypothetical protein
MGRLFRVASLAVFVAIVAVVVGQIGSSELAAAGNGGSYKVTFLANGDNANFTYYTEAADPDKWSQCPISLSVSRTGAARAPETYLYYSIYQWDPDFILDPLPDKCSVIPDAEFCTPGACRLVEAGQGKIPNSSYRVNAKTQTLDVDTRDLQDFEYAQEWVGDPPRTDLGGVISITWEKTAGYEWTNSGTNTSRGPGYSFRSSGVSSGSSAEATGVLLGVEVPISDYGEAGVGRNNGVTICWSADESGCFPDGGK